MNRLAIWLLVHYWGTTKKSSSSSSNLCRPFRTKDHCL